MRFGKTLTTAIYPPWRDKYMDYAKLKSLLREDHYNNNDNDDDDNDNVDKDGDNSNKTPGTTSNKPWTDDDEKKFSDEMFNVQLDKVADFQEGKVGELRDRVDAAFGKLRELAPGSAAEVGNGKDKEKVDDSGKQSEKEKDKKSAQSSSSSTAGAAPAPAPKGEITAQRLKELESELDSIVNEVKQLQKYSNLNYTGFLKIVKKHDRKRGNRYRIRPFLQNQLAQRPFNSEQVYSPLLNKMSLMYYAIRQHLEDDGGSAAGDGTAAAAATTGGSAGGPPPSDTDSLAEVRNGERYTAHKFWVHPENLLEVKTFIMRRLPQLVYSASSAKSVDGASDPSLTSLYFDNSQFELYSKKVERDAEATSVRMRWFGHLSEHPEIFLEQKTTRELPEMSSEEEKFVIKDKYVKPFLDGEYHMEKSVAKMERQGQQSDAVESFKNTAEGVQKLITEKDLQPVLRANYKRTAFQKPSDDRIRISVDTELAFIREDSLDTTRPVRDPGEWHRRDIDDRNVVFPFELINKSEVNVFPYAVLEIKLKDDGTRKRPVWVEDLMTSHLVYPAPRFSKFAHGVAVLFDDYVNRLPSWLSELEGDIRKEPEAAFEEEEAKKARRAADEQVVGSFLGVKTGSSFKPSRSSPLAKSVLADRAAADNAAAGKRATSVAHDGPSDEQEDGTHRRGYGTISSVIPSFTGTRYSKLKKSRLQQAQAASIILPEGVKEPEIWIKNMGPLKIEPKVWLANERTFLKWQHISVLLGGLAVALYTASGGGTKNGGLVAELMGLSYVVIAVLTGLWGYWMYVERRRMIMERSGRDFDNMLGPMVVSVALGVALVVNFVIQYSAAVKRFNAEDELAAAAAAAASPLNGTEYAGYVADLI